MTERLSPDLGEPASGRIADSVAPPLMLRWHRGGWAGPVAVAGDRVVGHEYAGDGRWKLGSLDGDGMEVWKTSSHYLSAGVVGDSFLGSARRDDGQWEVATFALGTGALLRAHVSAFRAVRPVHPAAFLGYAHRDDVVDDDWGQPSRGRKEARVSLLRVAGSTLQTVWELRSHADVREGIEDGELFGLEMCADEARVFVVRGATLVCFDISDGRLLWEANMTGHGGFSFAGKALPVIVGKHVIVTTLGGTVAIEADTGDCAWAVESFGARGARGGSLYMVTTEHYMELDAATGEVRLSSRLSARSGPRPSTHLAIAEGHVFAGDRAGRLWAIEIGSGRTIWCEQIPGVESFLGQHPFVRGSRLYIWGSGASGPILCCFDGG